MYKNIYINTYEDNILLFKEQTTGFFEDNILTYHTDNDNIKINLQDFSFTKENNETKLRITKNECTLTIKELNSTLNIPIEKLNYEVAKDSLTFEYKLLSQKKPLKIIITQGCEINEI